MRIFFVLSVLILSSLVQPAHAKRIQNLSMTPGEMLDRGVNVNKPGVPLGGTNSLPSYNQGIGNNMNSGVPPITAGEIPSPNGQYMDGYCDPNFKPLVSRNAQYAAMASCLEQQKNQACEMYRALPEDARAAINGSINCVAKQGDAASGAGDNEDAFGVWGGTHNTTAACAKMDVKRLEILKRYWGNDQNTSYALVFLPDLVMDNSGNCLKR